MAELINSWRLSATLNWSQPTRGALPIASSYPFKSQIIRAESSIAGVSVRWYRAGYLRQSLSLSPLQETVSEIVPLNSQKNLILPLLAESYYLIFTPVQYLPAGLKIRLWEYTVPQPDAALLEQLKLMR